MEIEIIVTCLKDLKVVDLFNKKYPNIFTRVELCQDLSKSGLTSDYKTIKEIATFKTNLQIFALIRRSNQYFFLEQEYLQMQEDIKFCKKYSVFGVVIGIITKDLKIDKLPMKKLIDLAYPLKVSFHKAFDQVSDYYQEISILKALKVDFCLTVCDPKEKFLKKNLNNLLTLKNIFPNIIVGGGVNFKNIHLLIKNNFSVIHLGKCVRKNNSFDREISVLKLEKLVKIISKYFNL